MMASAPRLAALRAVLVAVDDYSEERITDAELRRLDAQADRILGAHAVDELSRITTSEKWSPIDCVETALNDRLLRELIHRLP